MKKCLLFHLKSSFCSQDIQNFVFLSFPLFFSVGCCFRGRSKINLKVYDIINCLNKNLITNFVWYHQKEERYDIETRRQGALLWKNHAENLHQKLVPDLFKILVINPKQPLHARNSF